MTIHHELGHNFYQRAYNNSHAVSRTARMTASTSPGRYDRAFHDARISASGWTSSPTHRGPTRPALLFSKAIDKIAFLPFGVLIDQWRWKVFAGSDCSPQIITRPGGNCGRNTKASRRPWPESRTTLILAPSITCRRTSRTRDISWRIFSSFSSIALSVRKPDIKGRFIAARFITINGPAPSSMQCSKWE